MTVEEKKFFEPPSPFFLLSRERLQQIQDFYTLHSHLDTDIYPSVLDSHFNQLTIIHVHLYRCI